MAVAARKLRLVGRTSELRELESELRRSSAGELRCVLLLADPGVGKTRLATELLSRHRRQVLGLTARAYPMGATASFGVWVEALERHLAALTSEQVRAVCGGVLDDLAGLFRSVAAVRGSVPSRETPRPLLLQGLTVLLRTLAAKSPLVLFFDDVHLADASSCEALGYIARNLAESRILLLSAARPAELAAQHLISDTLSGLEQEGLLRRLSLTPLGKDDVAELAAAVLARDVVPQALVEWLMERSRGYPLFVLGLLRALIEEGADLSAPRLQRLPEALSERVAARLRVLDEPALATLEMLAVLGRRIDLDDLVRASGRPLDRLASILEVLVRSRLVTEDDTGRDPTYELAHPLIQESIYESIGGARRRALHRLAARALLGSGSLAAAAPHFVRSADTGDSEAIDALCRALRQAEDRQLHRDALALLGALLALVPPGDERWLNVLDALAWQAEWVFDHKAGLDALAGIKAMREIEQLLESRDDSARLATVKFRLSLFLAWGSGDLEAAERNGRQALQLFEKAGERGRALIAANELGWIMGLRGDLAGQEALAMQVLHRAEVADDRLAIMDTLGSAGSAAYSAGRFKEAEALLTRAAAIAREDRKQYRLTWNLVELACSYVLQGRLKEAHAALAEGMTGNPAYRDTLLVETRALLHWLAGDFQAAVDSALESGAWNPGGFSLRRGFVMGIAALAASELGNHDDARRYEKQAASVYDDRDWHVYSQFGPWASGVLASRDGRFENSLTKLRAAAGSFLDAGAFPFAAFVLLDQAEVAGRAGDVSSATQSGVRLEEIADRTGCDFHRALAGIASGWAKLAAGDAAGAIEPADRAVRSLAAGGCTALHGRALDLLGRALARLDPAQAVPVLQAATTGFAACGATWRRDRALEALAQLGHAGQRAVDATRGPASLSRREREVVRLAAQGQTARQIAERLFIGRRTVETHLAAAYAKLGVESKLDLIRRASELGV